MNYYTLTPRDVLFFRDGRPTETGGGHGARWPEPSVIFNALHAALWRAFPDKQADWEHDHRWGRSSTRQAQDSQRTQRFGSLQTAGLFPVWRDGRWLFPAPADVTAEDSAHGWRLAPQSPAGVANLPSSFLKYLPTSQALPSKEAVASWWSRAAWRSYLEGRRPDRAELFHQNELYAEEWTTGIGMDPETQTQDGVRIYSAQYLRLKDDVRCGFAATLPMQSNGNGDETTDRIGHLFDASGSIIVGGQQRACQVHPFDSPDHSPPLPVSPPVQGTRVKWVLLTPAIWPRIEKNGDHPGGWLPNWIDHKDGKVLLRHRRGRIRRVWCQERQRTIRQADVDEPVNAKLVAACVPKPIPIVGWTERLHLLKDELEKKHWDSGESQGAHGPRATHLAVPAGSVYYFECPDKSTADKLAAALNWHGEGVDNPGSKIQNRRSTLLGEQGFGLGVCGTWEPHQPNREVGR